MTDKAGEDLLRLPENGVPATSPQEIEQESGSRQNPTRNCTRKAELLQA